VLKKTKALRRKRTSLFFGQHKHTFFKALRGRRTTGQQLYYEYYASFARETKKFSAFFFPLVALLLLLLFRPLGEEEQKKTTIQRGVTKWSQLSQREDLYKRSPKKIFRVLNP